MTTSKKTYKMEWLEGDKDHYTIEEIADAMREGYEDEYDNIPDEAKPKVEKLLRESGHWDKLIMNDPSIKKYLWDSRMCTASYISICLRYGSKWTDVPDEAKSEVRKVMKDRYTWDRYKKIQKERNGLDLDTEVDKIEQSAQNGDCEL